MSFRPGTGTSRFFAIASPILLLTAACRVDSTPQAESDSPPNPTETTPYGGERHAIPGRIEAEHFDLGPAGQAYLDNDPENQGADYREPTQVDIEARPDASNGHGLGWTLAGEWVTYSVTVTQPGTYGLTIPVASDKLGGSFHIEMNGEDVSGPIQTPDTGGWDKLQLLSITDVQLSQGDHTMRIVMDSDGPSGSVADIDYLEFTLRDR